jgi:CubicO group peptidase (beta-lactamase class C family)
MMGWMALLVAAMLLSLVLLEAMHAMGSAKSGPLGAATPSVHTRALKLRSIPGVPPLPDPAPQSTAFVGQVDSLLNSMVAQQQFSGSILIARNGQVLMSKGYSMADWDRNTPNTPQTRFYLGSVTKQFTAMGILILQEQGKLKVTDRLCDHLDHCPPPWRPVTIQNMLTHSSGIPQIDDSSLSSASPEAWIASYDNVPLAFTPGSQFNYCSVCYQILGYVIEQVSGEPYKTFLPQVIFKPLHMDNTGFDPHYLSFPNSSVGYAAWQVKAPTLGFDLAPMWSFLDGSGLLYTTVEDLYRWDQALYTQQLVSQQTLNAAFTSYYPAQYPGSSYGYGWFIKKAPIAGHRLIWHDGRIDGFRTYIGRYVDDHVTIIFLSNLATLDELALADKLEQIVFSSQ